MIDKKRRDFIASIALAPLLWSRAVQAKKTQLLPVRRLVLVELSGGNDGLNTVIPFSDPQYKKIRPILAIPRDQVVQLDPRLGLHPSLAALKPLFDRGELAIVQGLGYADPVRSHFRSIDIWDRASGAHRHLTQGWLADTDLGTRYRCRFAADAVVYGTNPASVTGGRLQPIVMEKLPQFMRKARGTFDSQPLTAQTEALQHLLYVEARIASALSGFQGRKLPVKKAFPKNRFAQQLRDAVRLLVGTKPATPIVKVTLDGFDTHAGQAGKHARQLKVLGNGLRALRDTLVDLGIWQHTLVMTYSEFGRRAVENASYGTDHGWAAPHLVLGGDIKGGIYGQAPDLDHLAMDDVRMGIDYRCLYNTVLGPWWGLPASQIEAQRFAPLNLVKT